MRNGLVDICRFVAACGIVVFHAKAPGSAIGYSALQLFTLYLVYFARPNRYGYLLRLWLFWSAIYGALKILDVIVGGSSWGAEFDLYMFLTGPALHLWFLPFAAVAVIVAPRLPRSPALIVTGSLALLALGSITLPVPLAQWVAVAPAVLLGIALAERWSIAVAVLVVAAGWLAGWHVLQIAIAFPLAWLSLQFDCRRAG